MRFTLVKSKNGVQPPQTSCDFYPPGGTLGRSEDNNFVLPDESRAISRLQVLVHITADGGCRITNRGNVIQIEFNGLPLEQGRQVELQDGDMLGIGDYLIAISALDRPIPQPSATPAVSAPKAPTANSIPGEIWDNLSREFSPRSAPDAPPAAVENPLTELPQQTLNPVDPIAQVTQHTDLHQLDRRETDPTLLFNEEDLFRQQHILRDTTPSTLQEQPQSVAAPDHASQQEIDPLALFGNERGNESDSLFGAMVDSAQPLTPPDMFQPASTPEVPPPPQPAAAAPPQDGSPAGIAADRVIHREPEPVTPSPPPPQAAVPPVAASAAGRSATSASPLSTGRMGIDPVSYQTAATQRVDGEHPRLDGELLQALLAGAGLDDMETQPQFDKEKMQLLGQVVSLFSQGTVALLSSRSMLKRGVNAEMTMILDEANNPFKLLPSGKTVLMQMFGSQMPGFMPAEQAVRDALIDLQAHQLGMIAGIRAIIAAMLQSFNPEQLAAQARQQGSTPRFALSASRKAALWDYFVKRFEKTADEIDDDFHTLFGEAFLHAYDVEVNQYKDLQSSKTEKR